MGETTRNGDSCYIVPRRVIQGSASDMLNEIDEAIQALIALRHLIAVRHSKDPRALPDGADRQHN